MVTKYSKYILIIIMLTATINISHANSKKSSDGVAEMQIIQGFNGLFFGTALSVMTESFASYFLLIPGFTTAGIVLPNTYSNNNSASK